jgi:hypothetical protein
VLTACIGTHCGVVFPPAGTQYVTNSMCIYEKPSGGCEYAPNVTTVGGLTTVQLTY